MKKKLSDLLIPHSATLQQALSAIDKGSSRIAFILNNDKKVVGILTDGDIRRAILKDNSLSSPISSFMNRNFLFVEKKYSLSDVKKIMIKNSINQVPVLSKDGKLLDLLMIEDFISIKKLNNPVVIMAGGKGKRLRPYTMNCPKPMLEVQNKPILEFILNKCINAGFNNYFFSVNYLKEKIIKYFEDGKSWDISINYLIEDKELGTAGSLSLLPKNIGKEPILIMNGDVITELDYSKLLEFHKENKSLATVCVKNHEINVPFGVVEINKKLIKSFREKPTLNFLVNAGVYIIEPKALKFLEKNIYLDMPEFLERIIENGFEVSAFPIHEYWIDIGKKESLKQAKDKFDEY